MPAHGPRVDSHMLGTWPTAISPTRGSRPPPSLLKDPAPCERRRRRQDAARQRGGQFAVRSRRTAEYPGALQGQQPDVRSYATFW